MARLAGLPASVVARAQEILAGLERDEASRGGRPTLSAAAGGPTTAQLGLFAASVDGGSKRGEQVLSRLEAIDVDDTTPRQALELLAELKKLVRRRVMQNAECRIQTMLKASGGARCLRSPCCILHFALALLIAAGCFHPQAPRDPGIITIAVRSGPNSLDPRLSNDEGTQRMSQLVYSPLLEHGDDLRIRPALASASTTPTHSPTSSICVTASPFMTATS